MTDENILIPLKEWDELTRKDERKNIQITDLLADNHNLRVEAEDLEATIEELERKIEVLEIEEAEELEEL